MREKLIAELEVKKANLLAQAEIEVREANEERFEEIKAEIEKINAELSANIKIEDVKGDNVMEIREMLLDGQEVVCDNLELRADENTTTSVGAGIPEFTQKGIVRRVEEISPLFNMCDKITLAGTTAITVQGKKLGKFVPMAELQAYANKTMTMNEKTLSAHKYGLFATVSEELMADASYDVASEINTQMVEGLAVTLDEVIVTGDAKLYGIEKATSANGAHEVTVPAGGLTVDALLDMYYAMPAKFRSKAVWVINSAQERELAGLVDAQGRPMLVAGYGATPTFTILGRPVVVNEFATRVSFVNLKEAVKVGIRKKLELKRDDSVGFTNDTIAFKGNVRLDIIAMDENAIVYSKPAVSKSK